MLKCTQWIARLTPVIMILAFAVGAQAATIGFVPTSQTGAVGDNVSYDVVVSNLAGEIVSAYDLDITFDETVLDATSFAFAGNLGNPAFFETFQATNLSSNGVADMAEVSLLTDASLLGMQDGNSVTLGRLTFRVVGGGSTALGFNFNAFNDIKGSNAQRLDITPESGGFSTGAAAVPEPSAALIFGVGVLIASTTTRRRS